MKRRRRKKDDQSKAEEAYQLIADVVKNNLQIESVHWVGGCWTALINCYIQNKLPFESFCSEIEEIKKFYKDRWET
jgi:hypothetical protein